MASEAGSSPCSDAVPAVFLCVWLAHSASTFWLPFTKCCPYNRHMSLCSAIFILLVLTLLRAPGGSQSFHDAMSLQPSGHHCGPGGANAAFDQVIFWSLLVSYCDVMYGCTSCSAICFAFLFCWPVGTRQTCSAVTAIVVHSVENSECIQM